MLKGKAPFMAPEQLEGRPSTAAPTSSPWASPSGRPSPSGASTPTRAPYRKLKEILPSVPASLDEIVRKALAHNPADRFPTAAAFADALEHEFRSVLATPRQVGSFMSAVGADKIQRERDAVRNAPKPAEEPPSARASGRTATRNTYGSRRVEEPIPATAVKAFESRPPGARTSAESRPANDTGTDDDPEVAAALQALTELPAERATLNLGPATSAALSAELPKPLIREERTSSPASRRPRPIMDFGPSGRAQHTPTADPGSRTISQRPRASTLQLGAPRREAEAPPAVPPPPPRARPTAQVAAPAAPTRTAELSNLLTRDIGGPDAQAIARPQVTPPPRARQNTPAQRPPAGDAGEATIEFKLVTSKVKDAAERVEHERADKAKPPADDKPALAAPAPRRDHRRPPRDAHRPEGARRSAHRAVPLAHAVAARAQHAPQPLGVGRRPRDRHPRRDLRPHPRAVAPPQRRRSAARSASRISRVSAAPAGGCSCATPAGGRPWRSSSRRA
jgi:hypothetical protein